MDRGDSGIVAAINAAPVIAPIGAAPEIAVAAAPDEAVELSAGVGMAAGAVEAARCHVRQALSRHSSNSLLAKDTILAFSGMGANKRRMILFIFGIQAKIIAPCPLSDSQ